MPLPMLPESMETSGSPLSEPALSLPVLHPTTVSTPPLPAALQRSSQSYSTGPRKRLARLSSAPDSLPETSAKIRIGVCAMDKKANSKPMREIIARIISFNEFEMVKFGDELIVNAPIEEWPQVDALLSWHSDGFPLKRAQDYVRLRRPFCVNDLLQQELLMDRRLVYKTLQDNHIPVPKHIVVNRDELPAGESPEGFEEEDDWVSLNGLKIKKPFVEKPVSGEDHNVYIYYPFSMGGGVKRLFRKVDNKSADYDSSHPGNVRRDGSYMYEEFLTTGGTDVKVYTVGPRYAHAEARKSPVVDGKVQRTADGKEVRFPVLLTPQEKEIARMVCLAFGQKVCGFDLLRSEKGRSYVCDVNGWSFVKNSRKYYDDAAGIMRSILLNALAPHRLTSMPTLMPAPIYSNREEDVVEGEDADLMRQSVSVQDLTVLEEEEGDAREDGVVPGEELRCVLAVCRHGDRTPKQKMKLRVTSEPLLALFGRHKDSKGKEAKLKSPLQLQELLDVTRELLARMDKLEVTAAEKDAQDELREKLRIIKTVLEQGGHFSGVNRKVQLKPTRWSLPPAAPPLLSATNSGIVSEASLSSLPQGPSIAPPPVPPSPSTPSRLARLITADPMDTSKDGKKVDKPTSSGGAGSESGGRVEELLLILKWGGVLTHAGRQQAENLGSFFRTAMYPRYGPAGGGLLRLHSTYRHDLKIYSSDEGRVQTSAAAFTKGLLDLEGTSLTPILVSLVNKDASMLDTFDKGVSEDMRKSKDVMYKQLTWDPERHMALYSPLPSTQPAAPSPPMSPQRSDLNNSMYAHSLSGWGIQGVQDQAPPSGLTTPVRSNYPSATPTPSGLSPTASAISLQSAINSVALTSQQDVHSAPLFNGYSSGPQTLSHAASGVSMSGSELLGSPVPPIIRSMPSKPVVLLKELTEQLKSLVHTLRDMCTSERSIPKDHPAHKAYSSLSQAPDEWELDPERPCSGERPLLMFDRWRKLLKSFYSEKKGLFDISKVPDIYDSVKHDAIHNGHLGLNLHHLYISAKRLADVVIPNEYGLDPQGKLHIGSKIAKELVGKLMADMENMREESIVTAGSWEGGAGGPGGAVSDGQWDDEDVGRMSLEDDMMRTKMGLLAVSSNRFSGAGNGLGGSNGGHAGALAAATAAIGGAADGESSPAGDEGEGAETLHRLCPTYASDINSPLRHVRTRIYFTSESHVHSLVNVLRFCHLREGYEGPALVNEEGQHTLEYTPEFDYLTHIVFRMYENKNYPVDAPERFRVEVLFSPGAAANPFTGVPDRGAAATALATAVSVSANSATGTPMSSPAPPPSASSGAATAFAAAGSGLGLPAASGGSLTAACGLATTGLVGSGGTGLGTARGVEKDVLGGGPLPSGPSVAGPSFSLPSLGMLPSMINLASMTHPANSARVLGTPLTPGQEPTINVSAISKDHVMPIMPRVHLNSGTGDTLAVIEELLEPFSVARKVSPSIYALQVALKAPSHQLNHSDSRSSNNSHGQHTVYTVPMQ